MIGVDRAPHAEFFWRKIISLDKNTRAEIFEAGSQFR